MPEMTVPIGHLEMLVYFFQLVILVGQDGHGLFQQLDLGLAVVQLAIIYVAFLIMHGRAVQDRLVEISDPVPARARRDDMMQTIPAVLAAPEAAVPEHPDLRVNWAESIL